jgi:hypothetical protein
MSPLLWGTIRRIIESNESNYRTGYVRTTLFTLPLHFEAISVFCKLEPQAPGRRPTVNAHHDRIAVVQQEGIDIEVYLLPTDSDHVQLLQQHK